MPIATVRGVHLHYEVLGGSGPLVALNPGGRRDISGVRPLGERLAARGYRVLLHDRRNCGLSDVVIDGQASEYQLWADDLHELLRQLDALPAIVGGSSSGCRTSLLLALRHPEAVRALLLWRVTGGQFAANRLAENYYGQYIMLAKEGGMQAVCQGEHWAERIAANPPVRDYLLGLDVGRFISVMDTWRQYFLRDADLPVIGATEDDLRSITVPVLVIPGNDWTHPRRVGENAARLIPNSELRILMPKDEEVDLSEPWDNKADEMAAMFVDFLNRRVAQPAPA
jgi:pimeloyl-ACP methyl ester carboxylesterase